MGISVRTVRTCVRQRAQHRLKRTFVTLVDAVSLADLTQEVADVLVVARHGRLHHGIADTADHPVSINIQIVRKKLEHVVRNEGGNVSNKKTVTCYTNSSCTAAAVLTQTATDRQTAHNCEALTRPWRLTADPRTPAAAAAVPVALTDCHHLDAAAQV